MKKFYFKCPQCQNDENFKQINERSSGLGCLLFVFGGFIPALLYGMRNFQKIQCSNCDYIFNKPPVPRSAISKLSVAIFFIILISFTSMIVVWGMPDADLDVLGINSLSAIESFIKNNPTGVTVGLTFMVSSILILITIVSTISNYRFRKDFRSKYKVTPEPNMKQRGFETNKSINQTPKAESGFRES